MDVGDFLISRSLPPDDLHDLPPSTKGFPDGAAYRVEIPSTEGPRALEAVLEEAKRLDVTVHRVSQGSGVFLLTDEELDVMARTAAGAGIEVSLFARPGAGWGTSAMGEAGELPLDMQAKISVMLPAANAAAARVLEDLGASTLNVPTDLTPAQ